MTDSFSSSVLSVAALFAEREARRRRDQDAQEQLQRRQQKELAKFQAGLANFQLTDQVILKPGGFGFSTRIINYLHGKRGDVGLFFSWQARWKRSRFDPLWWLEGNRMSRNEAHASWPGPFI